MRLIDADKWIDDLNKIVSDENMPKAAKTWAVGMIAEIKNQPTAFDLEQVFSKISKQRDECAEKWKKDETSRVWYSGAMTGLFYALDILQNAANLHDEECKTVKKSDELRYEVYEDNFGGLTMFVLDEEGNPIWGFSGYEYEPETLLKDIEALKESGSISGWEGNGVCDGCAFHTWADLGATLDGFYQSVRADNGADLVADSDGIYPDRMGRAALDAFEYKPGGLIK